MSVISLFENKTTYFVALLTPKSENKKPRRVDDSDDAEESEEESDSDFDDDTSGDEIDQDEDFLLSEPDQVERRTHSHGALSSSALQPWAIDCGSEGTAYFFNRRHSVLIYFIYLFS
jgi:hypothetical protein